MTSRNTDRRRHLSRILPVIALLPLLALPTARAASESDPVPIRPEGLTQVQNWIVEDGHHAFGFVSGAPAAATEDLLPPGMTLANCLEHKVPVSEPAPGTADLILEAWEVTVHEHPEWGVVRMGAVATCVDFPSSDLGYPKKDMATSGYESKLGLPTAPQVAVLLGWTDNLHMKRFMETFGLTPILADIDIEETLGGAAWTFNLAVEGQELYSGIFPTAQRNPDAFGERQYSPCQPVKQQGTFIEWPKGSDIFGVVDFQNAVQLGSTEVNANTYACLGGQWAWTSAMTDLLGPVRPSALAGSQPNDERAANRLVFHRYRAIGG